MGGLFGGLGSLFGDLLGANDAKSFARKTSFKPYNINTGYGSSSFDGNTATARLSDFQQQLQDYLNKTGTGFLNNAQSSFQNNGVTPGMQQDLGTYDRQQSKGPDYGTSGQSFLGQLGGLFNQQLGMAKTNPYQAQQNQFGNSANQFLGSLGSTDPAQLAQNYTSTLRQQAQPQNQRAVNSTVQGLFNTGRLGSSGGADILGQLSNSQNQQDLGFQQAGMDYSGNEQSRIAGLANQFGNTSGMFGQLGNQFQQNAYGNANNFLSAYNNIDQQGFNNSAVSSQLQDTRANNRFTNAMSLFDAGNKNTSLGLAGGSLGQGLLGQSQGIDQNLLAMIQAGGNLGSQRSQANVQAYQPVMQAGQQVSSDYGNIFGSLLSSVFGG